MRIGDKYSEYLDYLRKKFTEKTAYEHKRLLLGALSHSIHDKKISDLKLTDVADIIEAAKVHGEYGPQRSVVVFRRYLKFLKDSSIKLPFDWRDIEVPKVPHKEGVVFTHDELLKIFDSFNLNDKLRSRRLAAWSMRALCETLYGTMMRISEALSLLMMDWPLIRERKEVIIKGKGGIERPVFFTPRAVEWLGNYLKQRENIKSRYSSPTLFVNGHGLPLLMCTVKSYFLRNRDKLGLGEKLRSHTFRRTGLTRLLLNGANIKSVQVIAGHKSERTTLRHYVVVNKAQAKRDHERFMGI